MHSVLGSLRSCLDLRTNFSQWGPAVTAADQHQVGTPKALRGALSAVTFIPASAMREHPEVRLAPDHLNHYPTRGWVATQMVIEGVERIMSRDLTMDEASEQVS